jgi:hypothetical protein
VGFLAGLQENEKLAVPGGCVFAVSGSPACQQRRGHDDHSDYGFHTGTKLE